jgi:hypothetical protein
VNDQSSLTWPKRVLGIAGLTAAVGMTTSLVLNLSLVPAVTDALGAEVIEALFSAAAWLTIVGSVAVLIGFGWGRWLSGPLWTKGIVALFGGLLLGWGWSLLNRKVDLWGVTAQVNAGVEVPSLSVWAGVVTVGVSAIATVLVWVGAIRVLASPQTKTEVEPGAQEV